VTRANNRPVIENAAKTTPMPAGIHYLYHDLPRWVCSLKKLTGATRLYYLAWLFSVRRRLERATGEYAADVYHHLTFAVDWVPSFLPHHLSCATVRGPLGGYDTSPEIRGFVPRKYVILDAVKKGIRKLGLRWIGKELAAFDLVLSNNEWFRQEYLAVAPDARVKCISTQTADTARASAPTTPFVSADRRGLRIVLGGRMLYWKGHDAALECLAELTHQGETFEAVIIGNGTRSYKKHLERRRNQLGLSDSVSFVQEMPQRAFLECIRTADVFLYPAFYGSADSVMIEVIELGTPLVCFPSGGAKELLGEEYPYMTASFAIDTLSQMILTADRKDPAFVRARETILAKHSRTSKIAQLVNAYDELLNHSALTQDSSNGAGEQGDPSGGDDELPHKTRRR